MQFKVKLLDVYIIKKFLGTFFFALALIISIAVIFDISEKLDDFLERKAPLNAIIFDYYLNFIPYFANLFSPLFIFISVIYFTSRMASQTEIIAILNSGISFNRFLRPYIIAATFLALVSFYFNGWVIPHSRDKQLNFENLYIKNPYKFSSRNIHRQIKPGGAANARLHLPPSFGSVGHASQTKNAPHARKNRASEIRRGLPVGFLGLGLGTSAI